jgi:hypothetical protein
VKNFAVLSPLALAPLVRRKARIFLQDFGLPDIDHVEFGIADHFHTLLDYAKLRQSFYNELNGKT